MDPDRLLVLRLRAGESDALELCFRAHGARVYRLCLRMLGNQADAEDATQDVFLKVLERVGTFDGRARFSTWLYRLTINRCLHLLDREQRRRMAVLPPDEHDQPSDPAGSVLERATRTEARETLAVLLEKLSPEHRAVLVLREIEQLSYAEIASALEVPVGTVMSRLSRAREQLARVAGPPASATPDQAPVARVVAPRTIR